MGRDTSISLAIGDALRVNTGLRSLLLSRMSYTINRRDTETSAGRFYSPVLTDISIRFDSVLYGSLRREWSDQ